MNITLLKFTFRNYLLILHSTVISNCDNLASLTSLHALSRISISTLVPTHSFSWNDNVVFRASLFRIKRFFVVFVIWWTATTICASWPYPFCRLLRREEAQGLTTAQKDTRDTYRDRMVCEGTHTHWMCRCSTLESTGVCACSSGVCEAEQSSRKCSAWVSPCRFQVLAVCTHTHIYIKEWCNLCMCVWHLMNKNSSRCEEPLMACIFFFLFFLLPPPPSAQ